MLPRKRCFIRFRCRGGSFPGGFCCFCNSIAALSLSASLATLYTLPLSSASATFAALPASASSLPLQQPLLNTIPHAHHTVAALASIRTLSNNRSMTSKAHQRNQTIISGEEIAVSVSLLVNLLSKNSSSTFTLLSNNNPNFNRRSSSSSAAARNGEQVRLLCQVTKEFTIRVTRVSLYRDILSRQL